MSEPFLGQIQMFSFNFAPQGWATCSGQLLPINQNQALFSLLGTMYGGNGQTNFALPDLRGMVPIHVGGGFTQGERFGEQSHTLTLNEMPLHQHVAAADNSGPAATQGNIPAATKRLSGSNPGEGYGSFSNALPMAPAAITNAGGSQPHNNLMPYSVTAFCIALIGIFPSRN